MSRVWVTPLVVLGLSGGLLLSGPALANEAHQHDKAFFLRLSAGLGGANATFENDGPGPDLELSGMSGDANFAIGGTISRNLALHGTLGGWTIDNPDVERGDFEGDTDDTTRSLGLFGAGLTYYFMPVNLYLSGSLCAATATLSVDGHDEDSDTGFGVDLTVGKEWWVGNKWGLGVAGGVNFYSVPGNNSDQDISGSAFAIRLSATYN